MHRCLRSHGRSSTRNKRRLYAFKPPFTCSGPSWIKKAANLIERSTRVRGTGDLPVLVIMLQLLRGVPMPLII